MEVTFQNKREDLQAFYDYMVKETDEGKKVSKRLFILWLEGVALASFLVGLFMLWLSGNWQAGVGVAIFFFLLFVLGRLFVSGFRPAYYSGIQFYRRQEKSITQKDLQYLQLRRTIRADDNWLAITSSESIRQWRWRAVDQVRPMPDFTFIHAGNCPVVQVPKRDFPSEQNYIEFGKKLVELWERKKDQPIGSE